MKKYQLILVLLFSYLLWFYLNYLSIGEEREVYLADLNQTIVDIDKKIMIDSEKIYPSTFTIWSLKQSKLLKDRESKESQKKEKIERIEKKPLEKKIDLTKRVICLEKKCWELMGVVTVDKNVSVTLLSKEKKSKLETFRVGDSLLENLVIIDIKGDEMVLSHRKKKREFILRLFDVNLSKYIPKTIKDRDE